MNKLRFLILFLSSFCFGAPVVVEDIRLVGLQRVSLGSVLDTIPVTIGDKVDETDYKRVIKTLFDTGQFDDVQISVEGKIIFIKVQERPTISGIEIEGNSAIKTEAPYLPCCEYCACNPFIIKSRVTLFKTEPSDTPSDARAANKSSVFIAEFPSISIPDIVDLS